jgi:hypothetical protein
LRKRGWGEFKEEREKRIGPPKPVREPPTWVPPPVEYPETKVRRSWKKYKMIKIPRIWRVLQGISSLLLWVAGLTLPFVIGLAFMYLLTPGMSEFAALVGTNSTLLLLTSAFLSPFTSMISWLAWIVSGFVGGLILRRVLIPFLFTYGLSWLVLYSVGGEQLP